jgi:hypothetical protein
MSALQRHANTTYVLPRKRQKSVCKALGAMLVLSRLSDTTPHHDSLRLVIHPPRKHENSACKAAGATLAPPSFQPTDAFNRILV